MANPASTGSQRRPTKPSPNARCHPVRVSHRVHDLAPFVVSAIALTHRVGSKRTKVTAPARQETGHRTHATWRSFNFMRPHPSTASRLLDARRAMQVPSTFESGHDQPVQGPAMSSEPSATCARPPNPAHASGMSKPAIEEASGERGFDSCPPPLAAAAHTGDGYVVGWTQRTPEPSEGSLGVTFVETWWSVLEGVARGEMPSGHAFAQSR
jgi:hypothetical protein